MTREDKDNLELSIDAARRVSVAISDLEEILSRKDEAEEILTRLEANKERLYDIYNDLLVDFV